MIRLSFISWEDEKLENLIPGYGSLLRVMAKVRFKTPSGYTKPYDAVVDTGAHTSLLPLEIWQNLETKMLADYEVRGVSPKPECKVDVKVAKIKCVVFDELGNQKGFEIFAYLASVEDIPLIIGFKDLLEKLDLHIEFSKNDAWLG
ncbi:MAG: hypothetical protein KAU16_09075 [Methanophagales archaeon]|nr:hypothetical protein [Methanophagales archaeon]